MEFRILNAYRDGDMKAHRRETKGAALVECVQVAAEKAKWPIRDEFRRMSSRQGGGAAAPRRRRARSAARGAAADLRAPPAAYEPPPPPPPPAGARAWRDAVLVGVWPEALR